MGQLQELIVQCFTSVFAELSCRDKDFTVGQSPTRGAGSRQGELELKRITIVVTDRLYGKLEYLQRYWGMDSWAKVLENLVKIAECLISEE